MGKTVFNPITTKWRGAIGGFRYSVVRGKQVIAERASAVKNPNTTAQKQVRNKFKLASQFSNVWRSLIAMFLADKNMDLVETRALATKLAFASATSGDPETSDLNLNTFSAYMNSKFLRPSSNLTVVFTNQAQTITAANNTDVVYQVLAFGADGNIIAKTVQTVALTAGTPHNIILPATRETPARYDILAFEVKTSTEEGYGAISEIEGNYNGELGTNFYSNFREALESANAEICSMISASTLAA